MTPVYRLVWSGFSLLFVAFLKRALSNCALFIFADNQLLPKRSVPFRTVPAVDAPSDSPPLPRSLALSPRLDSPDCARPSLPAGNRIRRTGRDTSEFRRRLRSRGELTAERNCLGRINSAQNGLNALLIISTRSSAVPESFHR